MEKWRLIEGYENYMVSNKGNVMSLPTISKKLEGHKKGTKQRPGKLLKPRKVPAGGHLQVALVKNKKPNWFYVHRLVAQAWLIRSKDVDVVMHIDDDPSNNCVENLKWGTQLQNMRWVYKGSDYTELGKNADEKGIKIYNSIIEMRKQLGYSVNKCFEILAKKYNRSYNTIMVAYYHGKKLLEK